MSTKKITYTGILAALTFLVLLLKTVPPLNIPIFQAAPFLTLDIKDVITVIAGLVIGPLSAVFIAVIVPFIEMITISNTGWIGLLMNVVSSLSFVLPICLIYKRDLKSLVLGLVVGIIAMTTMMLLWNYIITPLYMKIPNMTITEIRAYVASLLLPAFAPFNLIKGVLCSVIILLLYKPVIKIAKGINL